MRPPDVLGTTAFRVTAIFVAGFAVSLALLGTIIYLIAAHSLAHGLDLRIEAEMHALNAAYRAGGLSKLTEAVNSRERVHPNGALDYGVIADGREVAGHLLGWPSQTGWSTLDYVEADGDQGRRRFLLVGLDPGISAAVAGDPEEVEQVKRSILDSFLSAFGAVLVLGTAGGFALSIVLLRRVETIRRTAEAIIAGDLSQRIPVRGSNDDFDRLSDTLNRMLDRIRELMESLREVSADLAHQLKTPLARLRQRLESALNDPERTSNRELESAVAQVDEILSTFSALLRVVQIEAGTRRSGFAVVDLSEIFTTVAEAFSPAAEDAGHSLATSIASGIAITGDRELLTQMLANLVENAIQHNESGTLISMDLHRDGAQILGSVSDNGRGIPVAERERVFNRFHRLPESHGTPGSGLGLSLVRAVADLHAIDVTAEDADPGLRVSMCFPADRQ